jgi:cysteine desulfurase
MKIESRKIYLDYNATTPVHPKVVKIMEKYFLKDFGNAGSVHEFGLMAHNGLDYARKQCAQIVQADPTEIIFTSSGTESNNMVLQGRMYRYKEQNPEINPHLIIDTIEHPSVWETAKFLEKEGFEVTKVPVDAKGSVNPSDVEAAIKRNTCLISIMYANNEIGTLNPINEIGQIAHQHDILFHSDTVQAIGKLPINPKEENIDFLSLSAHKLYGPKGVGFLFTQNLPNTPKNESSANQFLRPLMFGGSQEFNLRPATENVPGIVGMGKAVEIANGDLENESKRMKKLRDYLIDHILNDIPDTELNGNKYNRLPNNINILFRNLEAYDLMIELDNAGIAVSVGAACHAGETKPSRVLLNIGRTEQEAASSMRFSIGRWTTQEHLDRLLRLLDKFVPKLRKQ